MPFQALTLPLFVPSLSLSKPLACFAVSSWAGTFAQQPTASI
jgi:hypothetical protein